MGIIHVTSAGSGRGLDEVEELKQDCFSTYHPIINITYFILVLAFAMFAMHPVFLAVSCVSSFLYYIYLKGKRAFRPALWYYAACIYFIGSHQSAV